LREVALVVGAGGEQRHGEDDRKGERGGPGHVGAGVAIIRLWRGGNIKKKAIVTDHTDGPPAIPDISNHRSEDCRRGGPRMSEFFTELGLGFRSFAWLVAASLMLTMVGLTVESGGTVASAEQILSTIEQGR
jgi:hypothetical protein